MKTQTKLFTRQQRLDNECTHEEYYSQFVNQKMLNDVVGFFGESELKKAFEEDKHFNTIRLSAWDSFGEFDIRQGQYGIGAKMKEIGDYLTVAGLVCIGKQAARQAINK